MILDWDLFGFASQMEDGDADFADYADFY